MAVRRYFGRIGAAPWSGISSAQSESVRSAALIAMPDSIGSNTRRYRIAGYQSGLASQFFSLKSHLSVSAFNQALRNGPTTTLEQPARIQLCTFIAKREGANLCLFESACPLWLWARYWRALIGLDRLSARIKVARKAPFTARWTSFPYISRCATTRNTWPAIWRRTSSASLKTASRRLWIARPRPVPRAEDRDARERRDGGHQRATH